MKPKQHSVPPGAVTPQMIVSTCRVCAYRRGASGIVPWTASDVLCHEACVDGDGWVHGHAVTPETERAAEKLYQKRAT